MKKQIFNNQYSSNLENSKERDSSKLRSEKKVYLKISSSEDDEFQPEYHTMKKLKLPINRSRLNKGNWSKEENKVYLKFLLNNRDSFTTESLRRQDRVFCQLSEILHKRRTPDQCRSHHQKLMGRHKDQFQTLIKKLERKISGNCHRIEPKIKIRIIGKYFKRNMQKKLTVLKPTYESQSSPLQQQLRKRIYISELKILQTKEKQFYKIVTFCNSPGILIQIDEKQIQSY